jgi:hypothetical protein
MRSTENSGAWVSLDVLPTEMGVSVIGSLLLERFHLFFLLGGKGTSNIVEPTLSNTLKIEEPL